MKKNSKRQIKDYSKYDATNPEYYGLLIKNSQVRIDSKRLEKVSSLDNRIFEHMNKPRKTVYFVPHKKKYDDYMCNIFRSTLDGLENFWRKEFINAFRSIKTPKQAHSDAYSGYFMQTGILEADELSIHANMAQMGRSVEYSFIMQSLVAQFIHQMVSTIEAVTIRVITLQGYDKQKFNRDLFDAFIQGRKKGIKLEDIEGYLDYDRLYHVWNFLKHNSMDLYEKIQRKFPDLLYDEEYKNGQLALSVLKIDRKFVTQIIKKIGIFFDNLCAKAFDEDVTNADWDYDEFFIQFVDDVIEGITNPLGLPWYI
jgi:hypothetical protein